MKRKHEKQQERSSINDNHPEGFWSSVITNIMIMSMSVVVILIIIKFIEISLK
jgi:hypothetical protein